MYRIILLIVLVFIISCQKNEVKLGVPTGGDFAIETTRGRFHTMAHQGKVVFIFFGFTHCPQICPTTLSNLRKMVQKLPADERKNLEILFVTVDPKRDTLEVLKERLKNYPENFFGASTNEHDLKHIMAKFGASYRVFPGASPDETIIDHTSDVLVINNKGIWVNSLKYNSSIDEFIDAFKNANKLSPLHAKHRRDRVLEVLDENNSCDLSKGPCEIQDYQVSISPIPVVPEKDFSVTVKMLKSTAAKPLEIDFEGIDLNMGYIRPKLSYVEDQLYRGEFYIPSCELQEMQWRVRLIVDTSKGSKAFGLYLKSIIPKP
jgi:protein SCO1/2